MWDARTGSGGGAAAAMARGGGDVRRNMGQAFAVAWCRDGETLAVGRGLHSSKFQPNLSALYGIGGARRGCVARIKGVCRVCRVFSCVRHGSS